MQVVKQIYDSSPKLHLHECHSTPTCKKRFRLIHTQLEHTGASHANPASAAVGALHGDGVLNQLFMDVKTWSCVVGPTNFCCSGHTCQMKAPTGITLQAEPQFGRVSSPMPVHRQNLKSSGGGVYTGNAFHCRFLFQNLWVSRLTRSPTGHGETWNGH